MSLKYRDSQGTETPVAGLNGTSGELVPSVALVQRGVFNLPATSGQDSTGVVSVTFSTPMPDTDYEVMLVDGTVWGRLLYVDTKKTTGFRVRWMQVQASGYLLATQGTWTAFKLMTDTVHQADSALIAQNTANFAPAFSASVSYAVGDYVTYNNILYRCTTAHTAGVWVAGHFTQETVGGTLGAIVPSNASASNKLVSELDMNTYAKPHIYSLSGATYTTLQSLFDELITRLKADAVGSGYGICFMGIWTGKSYFEGSFFTEDGRRSYFKITFQNPQDSKYLFTGYTKSSDPQVTYHGIA